MQNIFAKFSDSHKLNFGSLLLSRYTISKLRSIYLLNEQLTVFVSISPDLIYKLTCHSEHTFIMFSMNL